MVTATSQFFHRRDIQKCNKYKPNGVCNIILSRVLFTIRDVMQIPTSDRKLRLDILETLSTRKHFKLVRTTLCRKHEINRIISIAGNIIKMPKMTNNKLPYG